MDSKKENDEILQFLNESNFVKDGTADRIWLGMNSGKRAGNYVIDNSRPQKTIDWFNWDQNSGSNESGSKNSIQMNTTTGTWFRTTRNGSAAAICSIPILTKWMTHNLWFIKSNLLINLSWEMVAIKYWIWIWLISYHWYHIKELQCYLSLKKADKGYINWVNSGCNFFQKWILSRFANPTAISLLAIFYQFNNI